MKSKLITNFYSDETIAGEFSPDLVPNTHTLVRDEADGENIHVCYYIVPTPLWQEFCHLRRRLYKESQLIYQHKEHFSALCYIETAEQSFSPWDFELPDTPLERQGTYTYDTLGNIVEDHNNE